MNVMKKQPTVKGKAKVKAKAPVVTKTKPKAKVTGGIKKNSGPLTEFVPKFSKEFDMPDAFLAQLNEFCGGGFALVLLDNHGEPQIYAHSDNPAQAVALQAFACNYFNNMGGILGNRIHED